MNTATAAQHLRCGSSGPADETPRSISWMADQSAFRPPLFPLIAIDALLRLLTTLPADWQLSIEDWSLVLIFDSEGQPRGSIQVSDRGLIHQDHVHDVFPT